MDLNLSWKGLGQSYSINLYLYNIRIIRNSHVQVLLEIGPYKFYWYEFKKSLKIAIKNVTKLWVLVTSISKVFDG